jgi:hypothetical protein
MKLFGVEINKFRIAHALFGWSLCLPSGKDSAKPFEAKITSNESDEESWVEPLDIAEDSILRQTDPILMTRRERHESTVRYWMERKGYDRKDIEKPLTDERMREIGRMVYKDFKESQEKRKEKFIERFPNDPMSLALMLDKPSHLDLQEEIVDS